MELSIEGVALRKLFEAKALEEKYRNHTLEIPRHYFDDETDRERGLKELDAFLNEFSGHTSFEIIKAASKRISPSDAASLPELAQQGVLEYLKSRPGPQVIDAGGGRGQLAIDLKANNIPNLKVATYDKYPVDDTILEADFNDPAFDFPHNEADLIVARRVMTYLDDPLPFVNKLIRGCKPGGWIYLDGVEKLKITKEYAADDVEDEPLIFEPTDGRLRIFFIRNHFNEVLVQVIDPHFQYPEYKLAKRPTKMEIMKTNATDSGPDYVYKSA